MENSEDNGANNSLDHARLYIYSFEFIMFYSLVIIEEVTRRIFVYVAR